ncbi:MAG: flavodoxin family protein [Slackia sp.]|nr:flavodoxin family protein [Slackia sp.]
MTAQGGTAARNALLICGSVRRRGVSARYADELAARLEGEGARVVRWNAADCDVADCIGCAACRPDAPEEYAPETRHADCVIDDDMGGLYRLLDDADEVHLVCPVYFAGPTGRFKCVLDRLQPYWEWRIGPAARLDRAREVKRPVHLHVIGAGGDPFGYDALVSIVRSAFGSAGFRLDDVVDRIGWGQPDEEGGKQRFS